MGSVADSTGISCLDWQLVYENNFEFKNHGNAQFTNLKEKDVKNND